MKKSDMPYDAMVDGENRIEVMTCPVCSYAINEIEYALSKGDPKCPRCKQETFSTFLPNAL